MLILNSRWLLNHICSIEMHNGGSWCSLVSKQHLLVIYHHLSSIAVSRIIYTSPQPTYFSDIFTVYLQLLCETAYAYKDKQ